MNTKEIIVTNQVGLFARPATFFVQKANEFRSNIMIEKEGRKVNAKSLLGVLSLAVNHESLITLTADGADSLEALDALEKLVTLNIND